MLPENGEKIYNYFNVKMLKTKINVRNNCIKQFLHVFIFTHSGPELKLFVKVIVLDIKLL